MNIPQIIEVVVKLIEEQENVKITYTLERKEDLAIGANDMQTYGKPRDLTGEII